MTDWVKEANTLKQTPKPKTPLLRKRNTNSSRDSDLLDALYSTAILVLAFWAGYILTADYYAVRYGIFCLARYCGA